MSTTRKATAPKPASVLIIDDEPSVRALVKLALQTEGIDVVGAGSAGEGLRLLRKEPVRLVLLDIRMPGMNAREFIEAVNRDPSLRNVRIAYLTVVEFPPHVLAELLKQRQVVDYIQKPFVLSEFITRVKRQLR